MGELHCMCGQKPCVCHNGWGTRFETNDELLVEIGMEIRRCARDWGYTGEIYELSAGALATSEPGSAEIVELWLEGMTIREIATELGLPEWQVEEEVKRAKRAEKRARRAV